MPGFPASYDKKSHRIVSSARSESLSAADVHPILDGESAAITDMRRKLNALIEQEAVDKLLAPYKKGGKTVVFDKTRNRYVIRIPMALKPLADGQSKVTADTEKEVYHRAYNLLCKQALTLNSVFESAMLERDLDLNLTDRTQKRYRQMWNKWFLETAFAERPIAEIKASEITKYLRDASADYSMTRTTYTNIKSCLHVAYDYAVEHDIITTNVARQIVRPRGIRFKPEGHDTYTDEERTSILDYIEKNDKIQDSVYYAAIYLMFCLCCRIGEIKPLQWGDYDEQNGTLFLHREVVTRNGKQVIVAHTKSAEKGNRIQYLSGKVQKMLNEMKPEDAGPDDLIFTSGNGQLLSTEFFNRRLRWLCEKIGIPYKSSHKIRFWAVTALVRQTGGDITAVGRYAGQACQQTTLHYIRYAQDEQVQKSAAAAVFSA